MEEKYIDLEGLTRYDLLLKSKIITSTTSGLKIEVVAALPANPDSNTIYIVQ